MKKAGNSTLEEQLIFQNLLLEAQFEASPDGILVVSPKGTMISCNSKYLALWGITKKQILGKSQTFRIRLIAPKVKDAVAFKKIIQLLNRHPKKTYTNEFEMKDGRWIKLYTTPLTSKNGIYYGRIWFIHDISERKKELEQQKYFLGIASHELRTPLSSIKAFLHLTIKGIMEEKGTQTIPYLEKIEQQINKLHKLIKDMLDLTVIRSDRLDLVKETVDFDEWFTEIISDLQPAIPHTIIKRGKTNKKIHADPYRMQEVFYNIINNAVKYSPNRKKIIISLRSDEKYIYVSVHDYGVGISKAVQKKIFDLFFRSTLKENKKIEGFGVGLYITAQIVRKHGGEITVESVIRKGTTVHITLPIS